MFSELCVYNEGQRIPPLGINLRCLFKMRRSEPWKECWKHMEEIMCKGPEAGKSSHMWAKESRLMWLQCDVWEGQGSEINQRCTQWLHHRGLWARRCCLDFIHIEHGGYIRGPLSLSFLTPLCDKSYPLICCLFLAFWLFYINMYKS